MAHFHRFPNLPVELQDMIWDHAIRDDQPAVQFLSIYRNMPDKDEDENDTLVTESRRVQVGANTRFLSVGLGAPLSNRTDGRPSWSCNNASIYMEDSGLWTACKASRKRMIRFFQPSTTSSRVDKALQSKTHPPTVHMGFRRDNGEQQYLTIRPATDLVCLQPVRGRRGLEMLKDYYGYSWETLNEYPPFFRAQDRYIYKPIEPNSFRALKNIAIEFDPKWNLPDSKISYRDFCWVRKMRRLEFFWFIDYRLKRRTIADPVVPINGLSVFHGRDCMFVEVRGWNSSQWTYGVRGWNNSQWTYGDADEKPDNYTSSLNKAASTVTPHAWAQECEYSHDIGYGPGNPRFGVLACMRPGNQQQILSSAEHEADVQDITA